MTGDTRSLDQLQHRDEFIGRHIGPRPVDVADMLAALGLESLDELVRNTVPEAVCHR